MGPYFQRKGTIQKLEKSIFEQNKLLSQQISRFFEYTKDNICRSLENIDSFLQSAKNEVKLNYDYQYFPKSQKANKMNWSFKKINMFSKQSLNNIQLALSRDSMKNIKKFSPVSSQKFNSIQQKQALSLNFLGNSEDKPESFSKKKLKISNDPVSKTINQNIAKNIQNNLDQQEVIAVDFKTLGQEGSTTEVKHESKDQKIHKFQFLSRNRKSPTNQSSKNQTGRNISQQNKLINQKLLYKNSTSRSKKNMIRAFPDRRKGYNLGSNSRSKLANQAFAEKVIKSIVKPVLTKQRKGYNVNRSKSAVYDKRVIHQRNQYKVFQSKFQVMNKLNEPKNSRNTSLISEASQSKADTEHILENKHIQMRKIRRNYMKNWNNNFEKINQPSQDNSDNGEDNSINLYQKISRKKVKILLT